MKQKQIPIYIYFLLDYSVGIPPIYTNLTLQKKKKKSTLASPKLHTYNNKKEKNSLFPYGTHQWYKRDQYWCYWSLMSLVTPVGLGMFMLAVRRSFRNSDKLILPSLSKSASSSNGSIDPFSPVCCVIKSGTRFWYWLAQNKHNYVHLMCLTNIWMLSTQTLITK